MSSVEGHAPGWAASIIRNARLLGVAALLLVAGCVAAALYATTQPTTLKIAVGPPGSDDVRVIQALAQQLTRDRATIRLRPIIKDGPIQSAEAMESQEADLAVVRRDLAMPRAGEAIAILRRNVVALFVPAQPPEPAAAKRKRGAKATTPSVTPTTPKKPPKIEKIADLAGRRVGIIGKNPGNLELLNVILRQYEIPPDRVAIEQISTTDIGQGLRAHQFDALMAVGPTSSRITEEAVAMSSIDKKGPTFLEIGASEAIASRYPAYESTEIEPGAFGGSPLRPEESVETIGFSHYIVANRSLSDTTVGELTQLLFGARQALTTEIPAVSQIQTPDTDKGASVAVHPGAAAYVDGEQKTFFDRYGDFAYWGLMLLTFLGSATAGVLSYVRANERSEKLTILEDLLSLMRRARTADDLETLDKLRDEADEIVAGTIHHIERNELDQQALSAFTMALDQVRAAIADRRALLTLRQNGVTAAGDTPPSLTVITPSHNR